MALSYNIFKSHFIFGIYTVCLIWNFNLISVDGQFPRVCVENATKPDAMCCPVPPGRVIVGMAYRITDI